MSSLAGHAETGALQQQGQLAVKELRKLQALANAGDWGLKAAVQVTALIRWQAGPYYFVPTAGLAASGPEVGCSHGVTSQGRLAGQIEKSPAQLLGAIRSTN